MDVAMCQRFVGVALALICCALPQGCIAAEEYLSFGQSGQGDALATITGEVLFCDPLIGYGFIGNPTVSTTFEGFAIESVAAGGECNPPPPPYPPPVPYSLTVDLGILANGQYSVAWTYMLPPFLNPVMTAQAVLWVEGGEVAIFRGPFE